MESIFGFDIFSVGGFYIFAAISIGMSLIVVSSKNILHALSAMALGMVSISAFYFMLDAEFLGVVQLIVYGGAIVALYAFAMMLFDSREDIIESRRNLYVALLISAGIAVALAYTFIDADMGAYAKYISQNIDNLSQNDIPINDTSKKLGLILFTKYIVGFELIGLLLLVALVIGIGLITKSKLSSNPRSKK